MEIIGNYYNIPVFYLDFSLFKKENLPQNNWQCFIISNEQYQISDLHNLIKVAHKNNVSNFHSAGKYGGRIEIEISIFLMDYKNGDIFIRGSSLQKLICAFWDVFGGSILPSGVDFNKLCIVCTSLDNKSYKGELEEYVKKFNNGWLPNDFGD